MNEFLLWLSNNPSMTNTLLILVGIFILSVVLLYVVAFIQGREISFWPPRIGELSDKKKSNSVPIINNQSTNSNPIFDLTGIWQCNDGATYYIRQVGSEIYWMSELLVDVPKFCNVAYGNIQSNQVRIQYADIPKGTNRYFGTLILSISENGSRMIATTKNGNFGGSIWVR